MASHPGERFGRYELVSRLGRGGMAETWRARLLGAAGVTKPVLIKKILPEYADDQAFISMFISEARISATLSHGSIAQVFDFGRVDGEYFLAMEFVDGQPLHRLLKRSLKSGLGGIPVPLATFIALEMCRGLHYAHTRKDDSGVLLGIVHRDISPDNVLISYEGQVKIVDFGIAKARALRGFNTEPGVVKGKYLFFSPEQARGQEVDARTDVWATGVVLYELLCGKLPVTGPQYLALPRLIGGEFPRPRELQPELPAELDDIVMRALAVDPGERYESSHAFGDALAGFLYSAAPRFSAMSVAYLAQQLFREELTADGREVQVPRSFLEELSLWRHQEARPAPAPVSPRAEVVTKAEVTGKPVRSRKAVALGVGAALLAMGAAAAVILPGEPAPVVDPSPLRPLTTPEALAARAQPEPPAPSPVPAAVARQEPVSAALAQEEPEAAVEPEPPAQPSVRKPAPSALSPRALARKLHGEAKRLLKASELGKAELVGRKCVAVDPSFAECHMVLGAILARNGRVDEAARFYRQFLRLAPDDPMADPVRRILADYDKLNALRRSR